jgi:polysaccharide biosynthesis/export protein
MRCAHREIVNSVVVCKMGNGGMDGIGREWARNGCDVQRKSAMKRIHPTLTTMRFLKLRTLLLASVLLLPVLSFAQGQNASAPGTRPVQAPAASPVDPATVSQAVDPRAYVIGTQDVIRVLVLQNDLFSGMHVVRPDGKITLPLIDDVQAEGLTPDRLKNQLTEALKTYMENPSVYVSLQQINSKSYKVTGWVNQPNRYPLVRDISVYDAIIDAGGFREFANKKDILIIRGDKRIKFNAQDFVKGKNLDKNILVENGDIIEVHD